MGIAIWWLDTSHGVYMYIYIWYTHKQQQTWEYKYKMTHNWGDDMDTIDGHGGDFTAFPCADSIRFQQWSINLGLTVIVLTWRFHSVDCPIFVFKILTQPRWSKITMGYVWHQRSAWEGPASPRIAKLEEEQAEAAWSCTDVNMGLVDAGVRLPLRLPLKGCLSGLLVTRGVVISLIQGVAV